MEDPKLIIDVTVKWEDIAKAFNSLTPSIASIGYSLMPPETLNEIVKLAEDLADRLAPFLETAETNEKEIARNRTREDVANKRRMQRGGKFKRF